MLQTIPQPADQVDTDHRVPKDSESRPWVRVRLSSDDLDVERIVANWTATKQGAPNVAAAIRLLDALLRGDLDAARVACPILNLIIPAPGSASEKKRPPLRSSDSERSKTIRFEDQEEGVKDIALALAEVTGMDLDMQEAPIVRLALKLAGCKRRYTANDVRRWHTSVWKMHWPGDKGDPCDLSDVDKGIGRVKPSEIPNPAPGESASPVNPYVAHECFTEKVEGEVFDDKHLESPEPRPNITTGYAYSMWVATLAQLKIQLNGSTYDTWLRHARLVEVHEESNDLHRLIVTVPHAYAKDWIDRHLLAGMTTTFNGFYCKNLRPACREAVIEIQVDGTS